MVCLSEIRNTNRFHTKSMDEVLKMKINKKICKKKERSGREIPFEMKSIVPKEYLTDLKCNIVDYKNALHILTILFFCLMTSAPLILVPQHDSIKNPSYWYEGMIAVQFSYTLTTTLHRMMECKILFNLDCFASVKTFLLIYGTMMMVIFRGMEKMQNLCDVLFPSCLNISNCVSHLHCHVSENTIKYAMESWYLPFDIQRKFVTA